MNITSLVWAATRLTQAPQRSPVVPHGYADGTNRWETVRRQPQRTRGGPEAAPSSSDRVLVSYWPLADLYKQSLQKITQRRGARTSSTAAAPGRRPGTPSTPPRRRKWPRARGTRGPGTAASSTAGRTSRMSRTRSRSSPPLRLRRARSFHASTFGTGRGGRTVVAAPPAEAPARPREPGYVECGAEGLR